MRSQSNTDPVPEARDRLLPWPIVRNLTGISRTTAWRLQNAGDFPKPVVISRGRVGWRESEIEAWKAALAPRAAVVRREPPKTPALAPTPLPSALPMVEVSPQPRGRRPRYDANQATFDF